MKKEFWFKLTNVILGVIETWIGPDAFHPKLSPDCLRERTNERKRGILHLLENHLAVAHHEADLNLLAKTKDQKKNHI